MRIQRVAMHLASTALFAISLGVSAAETTRNQTLIKSAQTTLDELKQNKFDRVVAKFDARMSEALPIDKLTTTWQTISEQVGTIGACNDATTSERDGFLIVMLPCNAVNTPIDAQFVFDADNKIAGMFIRPRVAPAG